MAICGYIKTANGENYQLNRVRYRRHKRAERFYARNAVETLAENMDFYNNKAEALLLQLREQMKQASRGDLAAAMTKHILHCRDMAIECAAKLAPYQNPKLQSVEVNKKVTHRFVIQAPKIIKDSSEWLRTVNESNELTVQREAANGHKLIESHK